MGLYFPSQNTITIVGSKNETTLALTKVALTDAYDVANKTKIIETGGYSKLTLDAVYTVGASETNNVLCTRIEASPDRTNFYQLTNEAASSGTSAVYQREIQFTGVAAGAYTISYLLDVAYKYVRLSFKETGVATNVGTLYAECTLSGQ